MKKIQLIMLFLFIFLTIFPPAVTEAYSNQEQRWSFNRQPNNQPATTEPLYEELLNKYGGFYIGNTDKKEVYITFDNGYENGYTSVILDVLKEKDVPAAFFVTGHYLLEQEDLIKRMVDEGHIIGNHSWHHPSFVEVSDERLKRELEKVKVKYEEMTGRNDMIYLRPPRGVFSERSLALSQKEGYVNVFWSLAYKDWEVDNQKGKQYAYDKIMERVHPGAIMLLHSVSKDNAEALGDVIDELRKQGYQFKSLDDYMLSKKMDEF
ncbi:delta-lactam-biosynthetic de-N-acetylase [Anaerobacillus arseniciselenatis]|uniref:Delta-lactam-biosynthetic de-N-acetylase n=1 Tax=Anaerobacillus arseniciselenatis TaxID=85682 RepID=A0A1S2LQZ5_9BACI|nr:delta-lactam-biosynthetic de-N-acetylase [Anaerobacillus arseniciselenatis]OIJ14107.1 delta-lactam-biosynthetic de-N-acetylase [Anaerobacillus arseniciselenatis]